jgi:hypothetical protein
MVRFTFWPLCHPDMSPQYSLTDGSKPVVDSDQHNVLVKQVLWLVEGARPRHKAAPMKPHHHVHLKAGKYLQTHNGDNRRVSWRRSEGYNLFFQNHK